MVIINCIMGCSVLIIFWLIGVVLFLMVVGWLVISCGIGVFLVVIVVVIKVMLNGLVSILFWLKLFLVCLVRFIVGGIELVIVVMLFIW